MAPPHPQPEREIAVPTRPDARFLDAGMTVLATACFVAAARDIIELKFESVSTWSIALTIAVAAVVLWLRGRVCQIRGPDLLRRPALGVFGVAVLVQSIPNLVRTALDEESLWRLENGSLLIWFSFGVLLLIPACRRQRHGEEMG